MPRQKMLPDTAPLTRLWVGTAMLAAIFALRTLTLLGFAGG